MMNYCSRPEINELEYHPWADAQAHELVRWCLSKRIAVIAYGSLGGSKNGASSGTNIRAVAERHGVSTARVLLRWAVQQGVVVIPGATSPTHIEDNLNASFEPSLTADDMSAIAHDQPPTTFRRWNSLCKEGSTSANGCTPAVDA